MAKPILLSVDDDSDVLRAIDPDLRLQYGAEYRVMGSDSPEDALDPLNQLKVRNESVALLLVDQRMPRMDGVEFLHQAMGIFPSAKRALLTAYADARDPVSRRAGRIQFEDRELSGLPHRRIRDGIGHANDHPGAEIRREHDDRAECNAAPRRKPPLSGSARHWRASGNQGDHHCNRRTVQRAQTRESREV